jgi:hypothetical protein
MNLEKLKEQICNIKDVHIEVIKAGVVFTLLLKGKGLSNWNTVNKINLDCLDAVGEKYSIVEAMKNDDDFFLLVLRS